jgi:hypothetical protein
VAEQVFRVESLHFWDKLIVIIIKGALKGEQFQGLLRSTGIYVFDRSTVTIWD